MAGVVQLCGDHGSGPKRRECSERASTQCKRRRAAALLDRIGFEVENLEAFTKQLEADGIPLTVSYRSVPALDIAIAFIKDPWGTNIELTEGLADID